MGILPLILVAPLIAPVSEVVTAPILASRPHRSLTYSEVASRITDRDYRYVLADQHGKPVDEITATHEGLHMLNASLSKPGWHGFYLGGGAAIRIRIPKNARLSQLRVPKDLHTSRHKIYVVEARQHWDDDILILADEALAYLAGAKTRRDLGWSQRSETIRNGLELTEFFRLAVDLTERTDPDYDITAMKKLLAYLDASWESLE